VLDGNKTKTRSRIRELKTVKRKEKLLGRIKNSTPVFGFISKTFLNSTSKIGEHGGGLFCFFVFEKGRFIITDNWNNVAFHWNNWQTQKKVTTDEVSIGRKIITFIELTWWWTLEEYYTLLGTWEAYPI